MTYALNSIQRNGLECVEDLNEFVMGIPSREQARVHLSESDIPASDSILENDGDSEMEQEELSSGSESLPINVISDNSSSQGINFQRTKRKEYVEKQEIAQSFLKVFFKQNENSSVQKDLLYLLYQKKVPPEKQLVRHIFYRTMWSYLPNISLVQSNYKEYIKGIQLVISMSQSEADKLPDIGLFGEELASIFNFTESSLLAEIEANKQKEKEETSNTVIEQVEMLENLTKTLLQEIRALKNDLKREHKKRRKS